MPDMNDPTNGNKGGPADYANSPWGTGGSNGGGNGGGKSPWGQGTGNKPKGSPVKPRPAANRPQGQVELDNVIRGFKDRFGGSGGGGGRPGKGNGGLPLPFVIVGAGLLLMIASSIYIVDAQEESVVLRFGEYQRTTGPGFNLKLPTPIERRITRKTREVQKITISGTGRNSSSMMLTGDENIVDIDFTVLWRIANLEDYLFEVDDTPNAVEAVAKSAMREIVGKNALQNIITTDRLQITTDVRDLIQATLDEYKAGVDVIEVQLQKADAPSAGGVVDAFRDVVDAAQDAETIINEATAYRNDIVPRARGEAAKIIQDAEGYKGRVTAEAKGEAERFRLILKEYKAAPRVTRERMYLETLEEVYADAEKIILDEGAGSGVVPYLSLNELTKKGGVK